MKTNCKCNYCGKEIYKAPNQLKKYKTHYCDNICSSKAKKKRETRLCDVCGTKVTRKPSEFTENVYCSRECYHKSTTTEYTKVNNKVKYNCSYCGKEAERYPSEMKGKKYMYCSMECKNKHNGVLMQGENHHRWNPDLTEEERIESRKTPEYIQWRENVYNRDDYTCRACGDDRGGNLVAHHILNFSEYEELRHSVDNGITLCEKCHKSFHDSYGYTNNNLKQLQSFIKKQE